MAYPSRTTTAPKLLTVDEHSAPFQILPANINAGVHFFEAFGNIKTEISARWIVRLCQERGGWASFSYKEIEEFCRRKSNGQLTGFTFNDLLDWKFINNPEITTDRGHVVYGEDGRYRVTIEFIARCYRSALWIEAAPAEQPTS